MREDEARFRTIVLPHLDDAFALARWITGNRADAEDVVQDAALRAYGGIASFAGGNPRAWVLAIVRNAAFDWLRKNRSAKLVLVDDLAAVEQSQAAAGHDLGDRSPESPEAALVAKNDNAQLESAIAALPPLFREALVLRDVHGFSYREIAEVIGVPIGTVMSRLARARHHVIATLGMQR